MTPDIKWRTAMRVTMLPMWPEHIRIKMLRAIGVSIPYSARMPDGVFIGSTKVHFAENSGCSVNCFFDGSDEIHIGEGVSIGAGVTIITGTHPIEASVFRRDLGKAVVPMPVRIERGNWLCTRAIVLPGVIVAEGCVIGAGSVVTRDTQANGEYVGSPARRIRELSGSCEPTT